MQSQWFIRHPDSRIEGPITKEELHERLLTWPDAEIAVSSESPEDFRRVPVMDFAAQLEWAEADPVNSPVNLPERQIADPIPTKPKSALHGLPKVILLGMVTLLGSYFLLFPLLLTFMGGNDRIGALFITLLMPVVLAYVVRRNALENHRRTPRLPEHLVWFASVMLAGAVVVSTPEGIYHPWGAFYVSRDTPDEFAVRAAAENAVLQHLKAPATAQFPLMSGWKITEFERDQFMVVSYVDAQNSFGALLRTYFAVELVYRSKKLEVVKVTIH